LRPSGYFSYPGGALCFQPCLFNFAKRLDAFFDFATLPCPLDPVAAGAGKADKENIDEKNTEENYPQFHTAHDAQGQH
jgi:hypothetical protein